MTAQKTDEQFSLVPTFSPSFGMTTWQSPSYDIIEKTLAEQRSEVEARKQIQTIGQEYQKVLVAHEAVKGIAVSQVAAMASILDQTRAICRQPRDGKDQVYLQNYRDEVVERSGAYLRVISDEGVKQIGATVARPTYKDRVPESRGIVSKVRGRDNGF